MSSDPQYDFGGNYRYDLPTEETGTFGNGAVWKLYATGDAPIDEIVSAACVFGYNPEKRRVMLIKSLRHGIPEWRMTGGHVGDPPFVAETSLEAASRKGLEGGGFRVKPTELKQFAVRQIDQPGGPQTINGRRYGPREFITYHTAMITEQLEESTGSEVLGNRFFSREEALAAVGFDKIVLELGFASLENSYTT